MFGFKTNCELTLRKAAVQVNCSFNSLWTVCGSWKLFVFSRTFSYCSFGSLDPRHVCVVVLLCKLCSHHQKESLGMKSEKRGSTCRFLLFLTSCFRILRMSVNVESAVSRKQTHAALLSSHTTAVIRGSCSVVMSRCD